MWTMAHVWFLACLQGRLTRAEFKDIFAEIFPFGSSGDYADKIFSVFDGSKDNKITFKEFIQVARALQARANHRA